MIPQNISIVHIQLALKQIDQEGFPENRDSKKFVLVQEGKSYPPKYVLSIANYYANGEELGYLSWHKAHSLIEKVRVETGINIKSSDNKYHIRVKIGNSTFGKYSDVALELLKLVRDGIPYEVSI
jgi:hypothetical protein